MGKASSPATGTLALHQIAALPMRKRDGRVEVCLVTTRETGRWTVPKGWPMKGLTDRRAAAVEAEQEAGLIGKPGKKPLGAFTYWKRRLDRFDYVRVIVYPLAVKKVLPAWKEKDQRQVRWMSFDDAAVVVDEPGLMALLKSVGEAKGALAEATA